MAKKKRISKRIAVLGHIHTIVEQTSHNRPDWQAGCYMGHKGFVLQKVEKLNPETDGALES